MIVPDASDWLQCQQRIFHKFRFLHIWMASGHNCNSWDKLVILKTRQFVESLRSDNFDLTGVRWGVFMVGPTTSKAKTTIVFSEGHGATRDSLARMLKESEFMIRDYPDFAVVSMKSAPIPTKFIAGEGTEGVEAEESTSAFTGEKTVYIAPGVSILGARIYMRFQNGFWRYARVGAILSSNSAVYCLSAAHAFDPDFEYDSFSKQTDAHEATAIFGLDDFSSDDDSDNMLAERTSRGSVTPQRPPSPPTKSTALGRTTGQDLQTQTSSLSILNAEAETYIPKTQNPTFDQSMLREFGWVMYSSSTSLQPGLDYVLIQIHQNLLQQLVDEQAYFMNVRFPIQAAVSPISGPILIVKDDYVQEGSTRGTSFFKIYGRNCRSQELWTIETGDLIEVGDSGSCVVSKTSGELLGHIVEANTQRGFAYMIPAYQILIDLNAQVRGLKISLGLDKFCRAQGFLGETTYVPLRSGNKDHHALDADSYNRGSQSKQENPQGIGIKSNLATRPRKGLIRTDSPFRRRKPGFLKVGKVFKAPWNEITGLGDRGYAATQPSDVGYAMYTKIRWFVVVKTWNFSCSCLPIQTYGGRGVSCSHLKRSHHARVYTGDSAPLPDPAEKPPPGESPLGTAIRVRPNKASDKLDSMSRMNFSKVYAVEHNVKVYHFGQVDPLSEPWLLYQFKKIFGLADLQSDPREAEKVERESSESNDEEGERGRSGYGWDRKGDRTEQSHEEGETFEGAGEDHQLVRGFGRSYEGKGKGRA